jgi:hypothetical protein
MDLLVRYKFPNLITCCAIKKYRPILLIQVPFFLVDIRTTGNCNVSNFQWQTSVTQPELAQHCYRLYTIHALCYIIDHIQTTRFPFITCSGYKRRNFTRLSRLNRKQTVHYHHAKSLNCILSSSHPAHETGT